MIGPSANLRFLLEPTSIAIVGASERAGPGRQVIENLIHLGYEGRILPVNPRHSAVLGYPCYPSLAAAHEAAGPIDAAALLLGRDHILPALEEAGRAGIRGAWAFASGFSEAGPEGVALQESLSSVCRDYGIAFCGPNCVGFLNPTFRSAAFSAPVAPSVRPGSVGAVAQSGSICLALANSARGIGFRLLVSSGNEAVLDSADYINFLLEDPQTNVVLAFIEEFRRPEQFIDVARKARDVGKPLIVLKVGRSELAQRAVVAHTGALAGSDAVCDAVFRKYGVLRARDLDEMLETAEAFSQLGADLPRGSRVGVLTLSGGEISLIGDLSEGTALTFPEWSDSATKAFASVLPEYASIANPLDAWGSGRVDETYACCVNAAVDSDMDIVVVSQDAPPGMAPSQIDQYATIAKSAAAARERTGKPMVAISHLSGGLDPQLRRLFAEGGIPLLQGTSEGLRAVEHLISFGQQSAGKVAPTVMTRRSPVSLPCRDGVLDEVDSKAILREYGIPTVEESLCTSEDQALEAAQRFGYPVVVKVASAELPHKTEAGVVALNIQNDGELRTACADVLRQARKHVAEAAIDGLLVQRMVRGAVAETIVGIVCDAAFGPVVVFGLGGVFVELLHDRALGIPPVSLDEAQEMISRTKAARLLAGFRGTSPGDVAALAEAIVQVSRMAEDHGDRIMAVDINPLLVLADGGGVVAVDGLIELAHDPRNGKRREAHG
jgi:acyl-CoA synthetase (NDP forming)